MVSRMWFCMSWRSLKAMVTWSDFGAFLSAFAGENDCGSSFSVGWRCCGDFDDVTLADGAFGSGGIDEIEIGTGDEDVGLVVAQHAGDAAGGGIRLLVLGVDGGLGVFECDLTLDLVGDHLLDIRGEHRLGIGGSDGVRLCVSIGMRPAAV